MKRFAEWVMLCLGLVFAGGCARVETKIMVNHDPSVSFSPYKTYRWMAEPDRITDGREDVTAEIREHVTQAIDKALTEKGFVRQDSGQTDFLVGFHVGIGIRLDARSMNAYYLYPPGWGWDYFRHGRDLRPIEPGQPKMVLYDRGAVVVDVGRMVDGNTQLIWRGGINTFAPDEIQPTHDQAWFDKGMKIVLEGFPPAETAEGK